MALSGAHQHYVNKCKLYRIISHVVFEEIGMDLRKEIAVANSWLLFIAFIVFTAVAERLQRG